MPRIDQIRKMLEAEPDDVFLNYSLAVELAKEDKIDDALHVFSRVIELDPGYVAAYQNIGKTLFEAGRHDEARQILKKGMSAAKAAGDMHIHDKIAEFLQMIP